MSRKKNAVPTYLHHSSGQARVRIAGRDFYLGEYGSEASRIKYGQIIGRYAAGLDPLDDANEKKNEVADDPGPSVGEIILTFKLHAEKHYVKNGKQTSEVICYHSCLRILREMYGLTPANDFGPLALKAVRAAMVAGDPDAKDSEGKPAPRKPWSRTNVNVMIGRIRRVFKHAIENEMIDSSVLTRLQSVAPLLQGRDHGAKDNAKRSSVDQGRIDAVCEIVRPLVRDLINLQLASGGRSGELLMLTSAMIDQTGDVWKATLVDHKTAHHGQIRNLYFGPQGKPIIAKYLSDDPAKPLFNIGRTAYCRAITRACEKLEIKRWTPHWIRHTYCTRIREQYGMDAAQALAGHSTREMTDHYSSKMDKLATRTAAEAG